MLEQNAQPTILKQVLHEIPKQVRNDKKGHVTLNSFQGLKQSLYEMLKLSWIIRGVGKC